MKTLCILGAAVAILAATGASAAERSCFQARDWQGWSAPGDGDTLYLKVGNRDIYQLDLLPGSHVSKNGDNFLVNKQLGSDLVCAPIDLNLTLSDHQGLKQPVMVKAMHKLTADEIVAIPPKDRP